MTRSVNRRTVLGISVALAGGGTAAASIKPRPILPRDLENLGVAEAARAIAAGQVTSVGLVRNQLARSQRFNPTLNALITTTGAAALAEAAACDAEAARGVLRGPLHGVPITLKDNIDTEGIRTTAASAVFQNRSPETDAEVWRRLRAAGAIMLGKANMHEFAGGASSVSSYFGPVRNPWVTEREAGGSSGGSAAGVAARMAYASIGTDTGGSVRIPAAHCGVVGFKPTYGLVSIRGVIPLVPSLDHVGTITRSVEDAALLLEVMAGYDRLDVASVEHPAEAYVKAFAQPVANLRLGAPRAPFYDKLDAQIGAAVEEGLAVMSRLTAGVRDASVPDTDGFTNLGSAEIEAYHRELFRERGGSYTAHFGGVLRRNFEASNNTTSQACSDQLVDHIRSTWRLQLMRRTADEIFSDIDLLVLPTMRQLPRTIEAVAAREAGEAPAKGPQFRDNCAPFNILGLPAISLPCGFSREGWPIGIMIVGPRFGEGKVLALAHAYEKATAWHERRPPAFA